MTCRNRKPKIFELGVATLEPKAINVQNDFTVNANANVNVNANPLDVFQIKWGSTTKELKGVTLKIILEPMRAT